MNTKKLLGLVIFSMAAMLSCSTNNIQNTTDDRSNLVTITDVVPDVILEIRYYGTYNLLAHA